MPSTLPKKPAKKAVKFVAPPAAPVMAPTPAKSGHHALTVAVIILLFLTVGCLSAAALMALKEKTVAAYARGIAEQLAKAQQENMDLVDEVTNLKTLQSLSKKVITSPSSIVERVALRTYSSPNLTLEYPEDFTVTKASASFPALTIGNGKGTVYVFRQKDFPNGNIQKMFNKLSDSDSRYAYLSTVSSPENAKIEPYNVWMEAAKNDEATVRQLEEIIASIKIAK